MLTKEFNLDLLLRTERQEGKEETKIEVVREMLSDGESVEKIAKWTKLPVEVVKELQSRMTAHSF